MDVWSIFCWNRAVSAATPGEVSWTAEGRNGGVRVCLGVGGLIALRGGVVGIGMSLGEFVATLMRLFC